ncbi:MAG: cupin domain-containing protein [Chitinivibrionales bacterium]
MAHLTLLKQGLPTGVTSPDGKIIEEFFGESSSDENKISIARMIAPAKWREPVQRPSFTEYTLVIKGSLQAMVNDEKIIIHAGESLRVPAGTTVRYANPSDKETEYWSICTPAFSAQKAHIEPVV